MPHSISDLAAATGMAIPRLNSLFARKQAVPKNAREAALFGVPREFDRSDGVQAVVLQEAGDAGIPLRRAAMLWPVIAAEPDLSNLTVYVQERADHSDMDFKFARSDAPRPADIPDSATRIDVGAIQRRVFRALDNIDALRITADPIAFPHRLPFVASHNPGAPWSIFTAAEAGELDAEAIARVGDAIEQRSSILACGATREALLSLVAVIGRAMLASGVAPQEIT